MIGKLYFSTARSKPFDSQQTKVLNIDNAYTYDGYNSDFGPLTLNYIHKFICEMDTLLVKHNRVVHHCGQSFKYEANGAFLMGSYLIVAKKWTVKRVSDAFGTAYLNRLRPFRDAGVGADDFPLTVIDCLDGIQRAVQLNWYSKRGFNCSEFEQMLKHGDLSWIVPDEIIAFPSPQEVSYTRNLRVKNKWRPEDLVDDFKDLKVTGVIRLNDKLYDASSFQRQSIQVHEMEFPDGSCPEDRIIRDFIRLT